MRAPSSKGGSRSSSSHNFRREIGRRRRPLVVPASLADAGLLGVPDGLDGAGADHGDLPGALPALPRGPRPQEAVQAEGLGVPRRWRDRRAGSARRHQPGVAREARQPDLRHQLQPAAARRSGARQRPDHPGARGGLPRRRLERDQGDLGQRLGSAAREGPRRPARQADGRGRRRPVPEVHGRERRLPARALLRHRSAAARDGQAPLRRSAEAAAPRRSRSGQGLHRLQGGDRAHRPAHRHPGAHDQGIRPRRSGRGQEHHPPAEEDERGGPPLVPHPLRHSDLGRGDRRRAVLPSGRRQPGTAVPARAPQGARRVRAVAHGRASSR